MVTTIVTGTLNLMSSVGIGTVVGNISKAAVPQTASKFVKACVYVGSVGVGGVITTKVGNYYTGLVNDTVDVVKQMKEVISNKEELTEEIVISEIEIEEEKEEVKPKNKSKKGKAKKAELIEEETEE